VKIPSYERFCKAVDAYYSASYGDMSAFIEVVKGQELYAFRMYWVRHRPSTQLPQQEHYAWYRQNFTKLAMYLNQIEVDIEKDNQ